MHLQKKKTVYIEIYNTENYKMQMKHFHIQQLKKFNVATTNTQKALAKSR